MTLDPADFRVAYRARRKLTRAHKKCIATGAWKKGQAAAAEARRKPKGGDAA